MHATIVCHLICHSTVLGSFFGGFLEMHNFGIDRLPIPQTLSLCSLIVLQPVVRQLQLCHQSCMPALGANMHVSYKV